MDPKNIMQFTLKAPTPDCAASDCRATSAADPFPDCDDCGDVVDDPFDPSEPNPTSFLSKSNTA
jgi:hypothetical protein